VSFSASLAEELLGLMQGLGKVTTKKMFGALGFYHGPTLFACLFDGDIFYLKATSAFAEELKALGSKPFIYQGKSGKAVSMPYWTAPPACLDDADEMLHWCRKAVLQAENQKPVAKKSKKKTKL
jgi:DNA transformation protein and related proteins